MTVIAVTCHKGGVGKSTLAANLSAGLASMGHATLLIDLDPQAHAGGKVGLAAADGVPSVAEVLVGTATLAEATYETAVPGLRVCPADRARLDAACDVGREGFLRNPNALRSALLGGPGIDGWVPQWVVIDCQPSSTILTRNAHRAADHIIVPVTMEPECLTGVGNVLLAVEHDREGKPYDYRLVLNEVTPTRPGETERISRDAFSTFPQFRAAIPKSEYIKKSMLGSGADARVVPAIVGAQWYIVQPLKSWVKEVVKLWGA